MCVSCVCLGCLVPACIHAGENIELKQDEIRPPQSAEEAELFFANMKLCEATHIGWGPGIVAPPHTMPLFSLCRLFLYYAEVFLKDALWRDVEFARCESGPRFNSGR